LLYFSTNPDTLLHPLENSYSEKSIASWFSFLQTGPRDLLVMLERLLDQVGPKEVLDVEFFVMIKTYLCS
jgi:hypothetical protein